MDARNANGGQNAVLNTAHKLGFFVALPFAIWAMLKYWPVYGAPYALEFFIEHLPTYEYAQYSVWAACAVAFIVLLLGGQMLAGMVLTGLYFQVVSLVMR